VTAKGLPTWMLQSISLFSGQADPRIERIL